MADEGERPADFQGVGVLLVLLLLHRLLGLPPLAGKRPQTVGPAADREERCATLDADQRIRNDAFCSTHGTFSFTRAGLAGAETLRVLPMFPQTPIDFVHSSFRAKQYFRVRWWV